MFENAFAARGIEFFLNEIVQVFRRFLIFALHSCNEVFYGRFAPRLNRFIMKAARFALLKSFFRRCLFFCQRKPPVNDLK